MYTHFIYSLFIDSTVCTHQLLSDGHPTLLRHGNHSAPLKKSSPFGALQGASIHFTPRHPPNC